MVLGLGWFPVDRGLKMRAGLVEQTQVVFADGQPIRKLGIAWIVMPEPAKDLRRGPEISGLHKLARDGYRFTRRDRARRGSGRAHRGSSQCPAC
jgi:hypothetical protein